MVAITNLGQKFWVNLETSQVINIWEVKVSKAAKRGTEIAIQIRPSWTWLFSKLKLVVKWTLKRAKIVSKKIIDRILSKKATKVISTINLRVWYFSAFLK